VRVASRDEVTYLRMSADKQQCGFSVESPYVELAVEVFGMLADATRYESFSRWTRPGNSVITSPTSSTSRPLRCLSISRAAARPDRRDPPGGAACSTDSRMSTRLSSSPTRSSCRALAWRDPRHHHAEDEAR
jgi:hypothetical protein